MQLHCGPRLAWARTVGVACNASRQCAVGNGKRRWASWTGRANPTRRVDVDCRGRGTEVACTLGTRGVGGLPVSSQSHHRTTRASTTASRDQPAAARSTSTQREQHSTAPVAVRFTNGQSQRERPEIARKLQITNTSHLDYPHNKTMRDPTAQGLARVARGCARAATPHVISRPHTRDRPVAGRRVAAAALYASSSILGAR